MYNGERRINRERKSVCVSGKKEREREGEREGGRERGRERERERMRVRKVYLTVFTIMIQNLDLFLYL